MNKKYLIHAAIFLLITTSFNSCDLIGDIFSAGFWIGIIVAAAVVFLIIFAIVKIVKKMKG